MIWDAMFFFIRPSSLMLFQDKRVLHGGSVLPSWEVLIIGGLILLVLVCGIIWLVRRAKRVASTDEGEGWGYNRFSIMRDEKSPVDDAVGSEEAPSAGPEESSGQIAVEAPQIHHATSEVRTTAIPMQKPDREGGRIDEVEPAPAPQFRFQAITEAEAGEKRSRYWRIAVTALLALGIAAYIFSPDLRDSLGRGWTAVRGRLGSKEHSEQTRSGTLTPMPTLDVSQSAVPSGGTLSLQLRIKNISSDTLSSIFAEVALIRADTRIPETRLAAVQPPQLGPNQEGAARLTFDAGAFASYQVSRMLSSSGETIPFRLTNAVPAELGPRDSRSRRR